MLLANAFRQYKANFKTALVFGLLLVFAPIAFFLGNSFLSSGTVFFDYNLSLANPLQLLFSLAFLVFYLFFYSFFVSIIVFSVRKDLSTLRFNYYLSDMLHKFAFKTFLFLLGFVVILFLLATLLFFFAVPASITAFALFIVSAALLFVPQAIVIDEEGIRYSVYSNFDFIVKNFFSFAYVIVTAILLLAVIQLVELGLDYVLQVGAYVSLVISLVFVVPYLEILKTYVYMLKYDLVKTPELLHKNYHKPSP
ncbi:MAG: hypothetical protein JW772_05110 [Candidatus Diapherotrites archaeon]|nr:hypothetical protein [Candidatus Diapherotrites archaeon]